MAGGPALTLCDAGIGRGGSLSKNDVIVFTPNNTSSLYRVPAAGGSAVPLTTLDPSAGETSHRFPWLLPDGRHFLYSTNHIAEREKRTRFMSPISILRTPLKRLVVTVGIPMASVYSAQATCCSRASGRSWPSLSMRGSSRPLAMRSRSPSRSIPSHGPSPSSSFPSPRMASWHTRSGAAEWDASLTGPTVPGKLPDLRAAGLL